MASDAMRVAEKTGDWRTALGLLETMRNWERDGNGWRGIKDMEKIIGTDQI